MSSKYQKAFIWLDSSIRNMLERLVLKTYAECTSRRVKWTSGARDMTISFPQLPGPKFLKLLDFNIVFSTISFRKASGPNVFKTRRGQYFLNRSGPAPTCICAFPVFPCKLRTTGCLCTMWHLIMHTVGPV